MKLIVGLGNPLKKYENTRHNVGFMVIDNYANQEGLQSKTKDDALVFENHINNEEVLLIKPQKYMNLSGEVVKKFIDFYKIDLSDVLIIHDDMDIEVGSYKLKPGGSSAGHNGLKNIEECLKTQNYRRLKIGISRSKIIDGKDYVLGKIKGEEKNKINEVVAITYDIINDFCELSFENLMNKYN